MPESRKHYPGTTPRWVYRNSTVTGALTVRDIDDGDTIAAGVYRVDCCISINTNVASSTITATLTGGGIPSTAMHTARDGAVAAGTFYTYTGVVEFISATPRITVTQATSPEYDITVVLTWLADGA